jgi:hypothetical protein
MLNVIRLSVVILNVVMLNVVMLGVVGPLPRHLKVKGLNPATTKGTGRESAKYVFFSGYSKIRKQGPNLP